MIRYTLLAGILGVIVGSGCSAAPDAYFTPGGSGGIAIISEPDGQCKQMMLSGKNSVTSINDNKYIYVKVAPGSRPAAGSDVWLVVEFLDGMPGEISIEYNGALEDYQRGPEIRMGSSGKWDKALMYLPATSFRGVQNGGSDFRFTFTGDLALSRIDLYTAKPDVKVTSNEERLAQLKKSIAALPQNGKPSNGMRYIYGDNANEVIYPQRRYETPFGCNRDDATIKLYKSLGVTSVETYVTWETCEKDGQGKWDWRLWDKQYDVLRSNGMKWTPFLILGPAYSTPDWFRASKDHFPCRCLEHGEDSKVESLWNPNLRKWISRFLNEFAGRYDKNDILESVLIGIQGDYGEAIYSVFGGWTEFIPGPYHAHQGFWCNDPYALSDYRNSMWEKYTGMKKLKTASGTGIDGFNAIELPETGKALDALNAAWGTDFSGFGAIEFPGTGKSLEAFRQRVAAGDPAARRQWLDFVEWYRGCMTDFADWWLGETKKAFPKTRVYLCTGGGGEPEHGSDFAEQCRVAAKNKCGVRITNEGPGYQWNNVLTRLVASAGRHYGAPFGFEPASTIDVNTIPGRIYNATISGSDHLHDYSRNIIGSRERMEVQRKAFKYLSHTKPVIPVALWYPNVSLTLNYGPEFGEFIKGSVKLRDFVDHDYLDETMLRSKALSKYRILVIASGRVMETSDARLITAWAKKGGTVISVGEEKFQSVEGTSEPEDLLFGAIQDDTIVAPKRVIRVKDMQAAADEIRSVMERSGLPVFDLKEDYLYASQISPTELLYLNTAPFPIKTEVNVKGKTTVYTIPASGITKKRIPAK